MKLKSSGLLSVALPVIIAILGTVFLVSYLSPWRAVSTDSFTYLRMAQEIQRGQWHIDNWVRGAFSVPPLYPLLVAISEWFFRDFERAGTMVSVAASGLLVIPVFYLARYFCNARAAWFVMPLVVLNPIYLSYASIPLTESLFTFIFLSCMAATCGALRSKRPLLWLAAGMLSGAAWMTRDVGIIAPFVTMGWAAAERWFHKLSFSKFVRNAALLTLGIIMIAGPLKLMIFLDLRGVANLHRNCMTCILMLPDLRDGMEREKYLGGLNEEGTEYTFVEVMKNPPPVVDMIKSSDIIFRKFVTNGVEIAASMHVLLRSAFLVFLLAGILAAAFYRKGGSCIPMERLLFPGVWFLFYILFYMLAGGFTGAIGPERYLVPLMPVLGIWASGGISLISGLADKIKLRYAGMIVSLLCLGVILMPHKGSLMQIGDIMESLKNKAEFYKKGGAGLKESVRKPGGRRITIMARSPFLPYYAGADWVLLPYGKYQEVIKFARSRDVDFLSIDIPTVELRPQVAFLLNPNVNLPEIEKHSWISSRDNPDELFHILYFVNRSDRIRRE